MSISANAAEDALLITFLLTTHSMNGGTKQYFKHQRRRQQSYQ
jgi:hypothetical protein